MALKLSLITTTYNESALIEHFICSIEKQTVNPSEVIIVDAGSSDGTVDMIKRYLKKIKVPEEKYKIFVRKGATRSEGRNFAISKARQKIIAVTDAGCYLEKDWLENLTNPFKNRKTDVVAGFYLPEIETPFQEALSVFVCYPIEKAKKSFLPSSRSIAFKKEVWLSVGGYPDELNYCEDLVFDQKIIKKGYLFKFAPKAIVWWPQRKNLLQAYLQFYHYSFGDGQMFFSDLQTHSKKIFWLYVRYLVLVTVTIILSVEPRLLPLPLLIYLAYLLRPMYVYRNRLKSPLAFMYLPVIKVMADVAVISGSFRGMLRGRK